MQKRINLDGPLTMDDSGEFLLLDEYHSDEDTLELEKVQPSSKTRKSRSWHTVCIYENRDQAQEWLKQNPVWSLKKAYDTEAGRKEMYHCNLVKTRGPQCDKGVQFQYNSHNQGVIHFETTCGHSHDEILKNQSRIGINQVTKDAIKKQLDLGVKKPKTICNNLAEEHLANLEIEVPSDRQLLNFLQTLKGPNHKNLSFGELITLLKEHSSIPDDLDKPFVMYQVKIDDQDQQETFPENKFEIPIEKECFRFFVTTKRLLSITAKSTFIHADSTYKLIWNNFPVLICGTSDKDKVFHPFGISVCTSEKDHDYQFMFESLQVGLEATGQSILPNDGSIALIADAADAITNGFKAVFSSDSDFKRRMCWFHVKKAVEKYLSMLANQSLQNAVLNDIDVLQLATNEEQFQTATKLFIQKYSSSSNANMSKFISYFTKEWLVKHAGWYEGYLEDTPSTNNGLESINNTLKKESTFRVRQPIATFLKIATEVVNSWSKKRDPSSPNHPKIVAQEPSIGTAELTAAYDWVKKAVIIQKNTQESMQFFFRSNKTTLEVNNNSVKLFCDAKKSSNYQSFDEYHSICFSIWSVMFVRNSDETNWKKGKCSCPAFHKHYICKHLIGIAKRLQFITIPNVAKNVPLGQKRQRGRPVHVNKALEYQPDQVPVRLSKTTAATATVALTTATTLAKRPALSDDVLPAKRRRRRPPKNQ